MKAPNKTLELIQIMNLDLKKVQVTEDDRLTDLEACTDEGTKNFFTFLRKKYELERGIVRTDLVYQNNVKEWNKEVIKKLSKPN